MHDDDIHAETGLSPRVRGNRRARRRHPCGDGPIPACAGEPRAIDATTRSSRAYPRVCGGTHVDKLDVEPPAGLSPRVRGNPQLDTPDKDGERPIPACAGEPRQASDRLDALPAYPRVCGGTLWLAPVWDSHEGLSPRVRGNPSPALPTTAATRPIPACAGEPLPQLHAPVPAQAYPRVCGGTAAPSPAAATKTGLSPRVRGNLGDEPLAIVHQRPIPACAGEPRCTASARCRREAYPRVCGGTPCFLRPLDAAEGLSPRVRGNRYDSKQKVDAARPIPACAGEPRRALAPVRPATVYPRVCGGTPGIRGCCCAFLGLSPRVRGNPVIAPDPS